MSKHTVYKETRLPWCSQIPYDWEVKQLKYCFQFTTGFTPPTKDENLFNGDNIWVTIGDMFDRYISDSKTKITDEAIEKYNGTLVKSGSLLFSFKLSVGKVAFATKDIYTNEAIIAIPPVQNLNLNFFYYTLPFQLLQNANENIYGAKILNQDLIKNAYLVVPPIEQQNIISNFLDQKTAELDKLILQKLELINCLKEERIEIINQAVIGNLSISDKKKPSGFEWVPTIPESWTTNKIKNVAKIFGRIGYRGYQTSDLVNEGEGAITLSPSNMKEFEMDFTKCTYLSWFKYDESPEIQIENGDILFVKTGSTYGKTALVINLPEKATINPQLLVFKEVKINSEFFYFVLLSQLIQAQVSISVIGGTIPTISQEKIGNYYLFVPPIKEQNEIVEMINEHLSKTDIAIKKIEQEIELINEYRAALINEAVTGKITLN
jgi:type I restriction enzyme S subunit